MIKRYIADLHFAHNNMAIHRGFDSSESHDNYIIEKWNSVVRKKDITYILGDVTMETKKGYELLDKLNGIKHVVLGNHDRRQDVNELLNHVDTVCASYKEKDILFTHIPIHPRELKYRCKINIHGHLHEHVVKKMFGLFIDKRYINVSCEQINYTPRTLKELLNDKDSYYSVQTFD